MWEKFPSGGPPPDPPTPPVWELSHFFTVLLKYFFAILLAPELEKNREKYAVGLGQTPPPIIFPT